MTIAKMIMVSQQNEEKTSFLIKIYNNRKLLEVQGDWKRENFDQVPMSNAHSTQSFNNGCTSWCSDRAQGCVKIKLYNRIIGPNISRPRIYGRGSTRDLSHKTIYNTHSDTEKTFTGKLCKVKKTWRWCDGNFRN